MLVPHRRTDFQSVLFFAPVDVPVLTRAQKGTDGKSVLRLVDCLELTPVSGLAYGEQLRERRLLRRPVLESPLLEARHLHPRDRAHPGRDHVALQTVQSLVVVARQFYERDGL